MGIVDVRTNLTHVLLEIVEATGGEDLNLWRGPFRLVLLNPPRHQVVQKHRVAIGEISGDRSDVVWHTL